MENKTKQQLIIELATKIFLEECKSESSYLKPETQKRTAEYCLELATSFYNAAIDADLIHFYSMGNFKNYGKGGSNE